MTNPKGKYRAPLSSTDDDNNSTKSSNYVSEEEAPPQSMSTDPRTERVGRSKLPVQSPVKPPVQPPAKPPVQPPVQPPVKPPTQEEAMSKKNSESTHLKSLTEIGTISFPSYKMHECTSCLTTSLTTPTKRRSSMFSPL